MVPNRYPPIKSGVHRMREEQANVCWLWFNPSWLKCVSRGAWSGEEIYQHFTARWPGGCLSLSKGMAVCRAQAFYGFQGWRGNQEVVGLVTAMQTAISCITSFALFTVMTMCIECQLGILLACIAYALSYEPSHLFCKRLQGWWNGEMNFRAGRYAPSTQTGWVWPTS